MALVDIDGILMFPWVGKRNFRNALSYTPKEEDVFVVSYPKNGTTWVQYIVHEILNNCCEPPLVHEMMWDYGRYIEFIPPPKAEPSDGIKRHFKTHLSWNHVPYNEKAKYIHICRNPWDACVSYYNFKIQFPNETKFNGTFDEFFNNYIDGQIDYGSYFDHLVSWLEQRGKENILFLSYEETKQDTKETVLKIAKFLGEQYSNQLKSDPAKMEVLLKYVGFDYMKNLPMITPTNRNVMLKKGVNVGKNVALTETGDFINIKMFKEGKVAYTKEHYSVQQKECMKKMIKKHFSKFDDLMLLWKQFEIEI